MEVADPGGVGARPGETRLGTAAPKMRCPRCRDWNMIAGNPPGTNTGCSLAASHNRPQEAPQAFAQAILDVAKLN